MSAASTGSSATFYKWKANSAGWLAALDRGRRERIRCARRQNEGFKQSASKMGMLELIALPSSFRHACFEEQQKRTDEYQPSTSNRCREKLPCTYQFVKLSASQAGRLACFVNRTGESLGKRKRTPRSAGPWKGLSNLRPFSFVTLSPITFHEPSYLLTPGEG